MFIGLLTSPHMFRQENNMAMLFSNLIIPALYNKYKYALCMRTSKI